MAWRVVLSIFLFSSCFVFGSLSELHSAEPRGPTHQNNFGVEVKGPASRLLHKQALEYMGHAHSNYEINDLAQHEASSKPPSKGAAQKEHASVLSVAIYTLLMASATVNIMFYTRFVHAKHGSSSYMFPATGTGSASILLRSRTESAVISAADSPGRYLS
jgi:hypothetical protein